MRNMKEAVLTLFEVMAYGGLLLLLPCVVAGVLFECSLTDFLGQVVLLAVAGTAIMTGIAIHEGWYSEHLSGWEASNERIEPSFNPGQRSAEAKPPNDLA